MVESDYLESFEPFSLCDGNQLGRLRRCLSLRYCKKLDPVYHEGDPAEAVYFVHSGSLLMTRELNNEERIQELGMLVKGDMFGFGEVFHDAYYITPVATEKSVLLRMEREDFFSTFLAVPSLNGYIMTALAEIVRQKTLLESIETADEKLVYLFDYLKNRYGREEEDRIILECKFTQDKASAALGISRVHFTRIYNRLKKEGVVGKSGGKLYLDRSWIEGINLDHKLSRIFKRKFHERFF